MPFLRKLLEASAVSSSVPVAIVPLLIDECPWLDGLAEISQPLAPQLLQEVFSRLSLGEFDLQRFVASYNEGVRAVLYPSAETQSAALAAYVRVLAPYGAEGCLGEGDYCVFDESFSDSKPSITVFGAFRFPPEAMLALRKVADRFSVTYSGIEVITEDGDVLFEYFPDHG